MIPMKIPPKKSIAKKINFLDFFFFFCRSFHCQWQRQKWTTSNSYAVLILVDEFNKKLRTSADRYLGINNLIGIPTPLVFDFKWDITCNDIDVNRSSKKVFLDSFLHLIFVIFTSNSSEDWSPPFLDGISLLFVSHRVGLITVWMKTFAIYRHRKSWFFFNSHSCDVERKPDEFLQGCAMIAECTSNNALHDAISLSWF